MLAGRGGVDESILSGESRPAAKRTGDGVLAGSVNRESPLEVRVERVGEDMVVSRILSLVERASATRPRLARIADRVARIFVLAVLVLAAAVAAWWMRTDPSIWLGATVAVLVVTCPCALSLATPTAITAAAAALSDLGLVPARGLEIERLAQVDHVVFDKTGTLTTGRYRLLRIEPLDGMTPRDALRIAAALEQHSEHPIATALSQAWSGPLPPATDLLAETGAGIRGRVEQRSWWIGAPAWIEGSRRARGSCRGRDGPGSSPDRR